MQVDTGGGWALVAEPQGDDGDVDSGVEEFHRGGVPQGVWCHRLDLQGWAGFGCGGRVFLDQLFDGVV